MTTTVSRHSGSALESAAMTARHRLPVAGKIRAGIKIPTPKAAALPAAVEAYKKGLADGMSFDDIAAVMKTVRGCPPFPLMPQNAPYFRVCQDDFSTPGAARAMMDRYGEVRPDDPERRIYAFPIVFPSNDVNLVFREGFEAWKVTELMRWSEKAASGALNCMRRPDVAPDPNAQRRWGPRPVVVDRACDPNTCGVYGAGDCRHHGVLSFWVPGLKGAGVIELAFTSVYASTGIPPMLEMVRMGLGRISGLMPNGAPIFWVSKRREKVSRMDWGKGKAEKSYQWIIQIEAAGLDMSDILTGTPALPGAAQIYEPDYAAAEPAPAPAVPAELSQEAKQLRRQVGAAIKAMAWTPADLEAWVVANYGSKEAASNETCLQDMLEKLAAIAQPPASPADPEPETAPERAAKPTLDAPF